MSTIACAVCGIEISEDDAMYSDQGQICLSCHSEDELSQPSFSWVSLPNVLTVLFALGGCTCTLTFNNLDLGGLIMGPIALIVAIYLVIVGIKNTNEPTWLRIVRPVLVTVAALYRLVSVALAMLL